MPDITEDLVTDILISDTEALDHFLEDLVMVDITEILSDTEAITQATDIVVITETVFESFILFDCVSSSLIFTKVSFKLFLKSFIIAQFQYNVTQFF